MTMPPWDENSHFQAPVFTSVAVGAGASKLLLLANPMRVGLFILVPNPASVLTAWPLGSGFGAGLGWGFSNTITEFRFTQRDWGPLVGMEWHVSNSAATPQNVQAVEIILKDWPGEGK